MLSSRDIFNKRKGNEKVVTKVKKSSIFCNYLEVREAYLKFIELSKILMGI